MTWHQVATRLCLFLVSMSECFARQFKMDTSPLNRGLEREDIVNRRKFISGLTLALVCSRAGETSAATRTVIIIVTGMT